MLKEIKALLNSRGKLRNAVRALLLGKAPLACTVPQLLVYTALKSVDCAAVCMALWFLA